MKNDVCNILLPIKSVLVLLVKKKKLTSRVAMMFRILEIK